MDVISASLYHRQFYPVPEAVNITWSDTVHSQAWYSGEILSSSWNWITLSASLLSVKVGPEQPLLG